MTSKHEKPETKAHVDAAAENAEQAECPVVVGIGASAGGLEALNDFFAALPDSTGLAYVVVQHLGADYVSMLPELLARKTGMPVSEIESNMQLEADRVYIIPAGHDLGLIHGKLQLLPRVKVKGIPMPIDHFFQALADDRQHRCIGILLSGTGSDGTLGMRAIKTAGGLTFAQDSESAQYAAMPQNAVDEGCVDLVMPPREIARQLTTLSGDGTLQLAKLDATPLPESSSEDSLNKIFFILRQHTGHDFSHYKRSTLWRRIKRRMVLHRLSKLAHYTRLLQSDAYEIEQLFDDILINVTCFFRDPGTFEALKEQVFQRLLTESASTEKHPGQCNLRIWVPGCSTGEEPYSIAMALREYLDEQGLRLKSVQIFATDIDEKAIAKARAGIYRESSLADLDPQRVERFFTKVAGGYQISKTIREWCIFAIQDVARDPPFSSLDLISCRNLLIYLDSSLQKKILAVFHFALRPTGMLMLGSSEAISHAAELFRSVDKKARIFEKKSARLRSTQLMRGTNTSMKIPPSIPHASSSKKRNAQKEAEQFILEHYSPPGVIIDHNVDIVGFIGRSGKFIEPMAGSANLKLLKMVHRDLAPELHIATTAVIKDNVEVYRQNLRYRSDHQDAYINLRVTPLQGKKALERYFLVVFEPVPVTTPAPDTTKANARQAGVAQSESSIAALEQELFNTRQELQSIINEQIATNEDLQAVNEEAQSTNEELQSTNEELESAKEELQSTNEELATVNDELESRNTELAQANTDLYNLFNSVNLPMLMLSDECRIRQFTPSAKKLLNVIDGDIGRPLSDLRPNIDTAELYESIREVITGASSRVIETKDDRGHWYSVKIRPYETFDQQVYGAVLVFVDITDIKQDPEQRNRLNAVVRDSNDAISLVSENGLLLAWNQGAAKLYGYSESEALGMPFSSLVPESERPKLKRLMNSILAGKELEPFSSSRITKSDQQIKVSVTATALCDPKGNPYAIAFTERDLSSFQQLDLRAESALAAFNKCRQVFLSASLDGTIQLWNKRAEQVYGYTEAEAVGMNICKLFPEESANADYEQLCKLLSEGENINLQCQTRKSKAGKLIKLWVTVVALMEDGQISGFISLENLENG